MGKFNRIERVVANARNNEGARAYSMKPIEKLIAQVLSTFFNEKKFYGDNSTEIVDNIRECIDMDPKFVANLGLFTRKRMHMRTISHVIWAELAHHSKGKRYVREVIRNGTERPDDMTEVFARYISEFGKPIPNSMKKGLADSFKNFSEFQLAKYNRRGAVRLKDIVLTCHPRDPKGIIKKLLDDNLKVPDTWETKLSSSGNTGESWEYLIMSNKLGYMALLRNLRNIIQANVSPQAMEKVYSTLIDADKVRKSKQLPFRFFSAYMELENTPVASSKVFDALETAMKISCENMEKIPGKTLVAIDTSYSMVGCTVSENSKVKVADIARILGSMASYICDDVIVVSFDNRLQRISFSKHGGIINNARGIEIKGGGTDLTLPIQHLIDYGIKVDRIIMLSDNEINNRYSQNYISYHTSCQEYLNEYRKYVGKDVWFHGVDLQGYGTQQFNGKNVNIISGWSEKVLGFILLAENGTTTLKKEIDSFYF